MNVDPNMTDDTARIGSLSAPQGATRANRSEAAAGPAIGDTVQVSRAASDLAQAAQAASGAPDAQASARAERVQQLQQTARSGGLAVDIRALADKILLDERGVQ